MSDDAGPQLEHAPDDATQLVTVGYELSVGAPTGIWIADRSGAYVDTDEQARLAAALAQEDTDRQDTDRQDTDDDPPHGIVDAIDDDSHRADDVTEQIMRADSLWVGFANGTLDITAVNNGIDSLLAFLQKLDRDGRFDDQLRVARSACRLLAVAMRWIDLLRSLRRALRAAKRHGNKHAEAWALHELGTLRLAGRDFAGADDALSEASTLRKRLGDRRALASTDHNLRVLCRTLRYLVREGKLVERRRPRRRFLASGESVKQLFATTPRIALAVVLLVLGLTGAVFAAGIATPVPPHKATLVMRIRGSGSVVSRPAGIDCPTTHCTAQFRPSTPVTLTATAGPQASFTGWGGACTGRGACVVSAAGQKSVLASFAVRPPSPGRGGRLTVRAVGDGRVTSAPAGITCPSQCSATFPVGRAVTLTETPGTGASFAGWSGDCDGPGRCTLGMAADHRVVATFSSMPTLTVSVSGSGSVTSRPVGISCPGSCAARLPIGSRVALTPHTSGTSTFTAWTGACSGTGPCTVVLTAGQTVGAEFSRSLSPDRIVVNGSAQPADGGTVAATSPGGSCSGGSCTVNPGADVTLTANATGSYHFTSWSGACAGKTSTCTLTDVTASTTVTATFTLPQQPVTVTGSPSPTDGGTVAATSTGVSCSAGSCTVNPGADVTLTATATGRYGFGSWTGDCAGQSGTCTLTNVTASTTVTATFTLPQQPVTVTGSPSPTDGGTVAATSTGVSCSAGSCTVNPGADVTLTATATGRYRFGSWTGDCAGQSGTCTLTNVTASTTVTATFTLPQQAQESQTVTVTGSPQPATDGSIRATSSGGSCSGGSCTVASGSDVTLVGQGSAGYHVAYWTGRCAGQSSTTCTLADVTSDETASATFEADPLRPIPTP